ncbi:T9SS type A sorting domain-containing protein [Aquimarina sp. ERC-38]|uniref:T9SS type A sorting domain-containing protein n=1 Tax=Aquimarina sp. ERC-38 TaxID=2949996 RepID=UPI002245D569|nr:T9SS type A sorting domain-containing protein [Aquimarina sp. ERC-38]UZO81527.1 T9SS type A sorting domain-containing protein [Aquimarina sp. ERC-38]
MIKNNCFLKILYAKVHFDFTKNIQFKIVVLFVFAVQGIISQNLEQEAQSKIEILQTLIEEAENNKREVIREKMTLRTAEVFLNYAKWDELNTTFNKDGFESLTTYKKLFNPNNDPLKDGLDSKGRDAQAVADYLPTLERKQVINILDKAIANIKALNNNTLKRKITINPDWSNISLDLPNAQVIQESNGDRRPIFTSGYNFMPDTSIDPTGISDKVLDLTEYYGADNTFLLAGNVSSAPGDLNVAYQRRLNEANKSSNFGNVFLIHRIVPQYLKDKYKNDKSDTSIYAGQRLFTTYDIDNPDTRILWETILSQASLDARGKKYVQQGYLLANEPHFSTAEGSFDNGTPKNANAKADCIADDFCNLNSVSKFTKDNFSVYLKSIHQTIDNLNNNYGLTDTNRYAQFEDIKIDIPFKRSLIGTPIAYDWMRYNQYRVTNWFKFLKDNIVKNDPTAITNIKLIPGYLLDNIKDAGLDFEDLTRLSGISGNDAKAVKEKMRGTQSPLLKKYMYDWLIMSFSYDFFRSVRPNQIIYNSEVHYFSTVQFRDLYLTPEYARSVTWLSHILGQNMGDIWVWSRAKDGSVTTQRSEAHAGSLGQQPAIVNEIQLTMFDLNAHAEDIYQIQLDKKPIRIFYSETSAINKTDHMTQLSGLYEKLYFDGYPLGFVTEKIIKEQDNNLWKVVLISQSPSVTEGEFNQLQAYLDKGGTIIIDEASLKTNEYGKPLNKVLNTTNGGSIITATDFNSFRTQALSTVKAAGLNPKLALTENKSIDERGCFWRSIQTPDGRNVISINNLSKTSSVVTITLDGVNKSDLQIKNMFNGEVLPTSEIELKPEEVLLLDVTSKIGNVDTENESDIKIFPNPSTDFFEIAFNKPKTFLKSIEIFDVLGKLVYTKENEDNSNLKISARMFQIGMYLLKLKDSSGNIDTHKIVVK